MQVPWKQGAPEHDFHKGKNGDYISEAESGDRGK